LAVTIQHPTASGASEVRRTPDLVDAGWLTTILRGRGLLAAGTRVVRVTPTPVGTGQMADTVRFAMEYDPIGAGPASVVGKFASQDPQSLATGRIMRAYEVEVRFYAEVAPRVATRVPRLLFAALDPVDAWFTLLLEDVHDATQGDEIPGCDASVAAAALDQLAALHAPCWEEPDLAGRSWIDRSSPEGDEFAAAIVTGVFPGFLERYADRLEPDHIGLLEAFIPRIRTWMGRERGPRTIVHADFRLDNLLFTPGRPDPVVVDFQTVNWGCGAYDLAYFVGGSLDPEVRRPAEAELIAGYHRALVDRGVHNYPLDALLIDYRRECFGGLMMAVGASMLVKQTDRGDRMFLKSVARQSQQAIDLDALAVLDGA
jgi:hypothetical protein